jgi:predicted Zn finger-like uncharacterized protein
MAQFIFTCPHCRQQFMANDEMIGTTAACSNCGVIFTVQKQMPPLTGGTNNDIPMLILGILGLLLWLIPLFALPIPIIGFILSYNRNYRLGIILNSVALGLSALWTFICIAAE